VIIAFLRSRGVGEWEEEAALGVMGSMSMKRGFVGPGTGHHQMVHVGKSDVYRTSN
jgi:hypothetical protein